MKSVIAQVGRRSLRIVLQSSPSAVCVPRAQQHARALTTTASDHPLPYGMHRVDYSSPPPKYPLPPEPPVSANFVARNAPFLVAAVVVAVLGGSFLYGDADGVREYWNAVEQGHLPEDEDDDDDLDDEELEDGSSTTTPKS